MHRFLLENAQIQPGLDVNLPPDEVRHAGKVLRLRVGDAVELIDGAGYVYAGEIAAMGRDSAAVRVTEALPGRESSLRLTLYMGLPKAEKLELVTQKLTELGAHAIVPVLMTRSVPKANANDSQRRQERLTRIANEAVKQCGRGRMPTIGQALTWPQALQAMRAHELMLMPWEDARDGRLSELHVANPAVRDIGLLIGPEGGIDPAEAQAVMDMGGRAVTLGPRILRTETAAIASAAAIMALWGDL